LCREPTGAGRSRRIVAHWRNTSRHACDISPFSARFPADFAVALESRFGTRLGRFRHHGYSSFDVVSRTKHRLRSLQSTSVLRPDTGQRESRRLGGSQPVVSPPATALAESSTAKTAQFLLSTHGGSLLMLSVRSHSHENGGSRSRTTNTSFALQALHLGTDTGTTSVHPVGLIRFSRANPSGGSGQDKTRSGENRANAVGIVGPHQIHR
jgi:hypothetical protein